MNPLETALGAGSEIVSLRRDFHRSPEPSFEEAETAQRVASYLEGLGLEVRRFEGFHGLWADLDVPGADRRLLFRADMDALLMDEVAGGTKDSFLSTRPGVAHCCGHDAHMAMLLVAARLLVEGAVRPACNLRFLFQHAEEKPPGGALDLCGAGCLEGVDEVYGLHVIPPLPSGTFVVQEGPLMAAADDFEIIVRGRGGHAAMPHLVLDPIPAAAQVVSAVQHLVSRRTGPFGSLVVSICSIRGGGEANNVIPDEVRMLGTARTLDPEQRERLPGMLEECVKNAAASCSCEGEFRYERGYPVLVNDPGATARAREAVRALAGDPGLFPSPSPLMAGEDFAYYLQQRPGCYVFLGVGNETKGIGSPNHATDFDVDEDALPFGTAWFLQLANRR